MEGQKCVLCEIPFHTQSNLDTSDLSTSGDDQFIQDEILKVLEEKNTQLKIMHLNTQSMVSTFNEFALTIKSYPLGIIIIIKYIY